MRVRVRQGLHYPDGAGGERRAEPGAIVDDLPAEALEWLIAQGHVEPVGPEPAPED